MGKVRTWKKPEATRGSTKDARLVRDSWEKRLQLRAERAAVQAAQKTVNDTIISEKRAEREQREERARKKEENKKKGQQYQVIKDAKKIKKMSKKQLRTLSKADTTGVAPKIYSK